MTAPLTALLERVEAATGPDRELDGDLFIATSPECQAAGRIDHLHGVVGWWPKHKAYQSARAVPAFTASVDAALAEVDRKFPSCNRQMVDGEPNRNPWVKLSPLYDDGRHPADGRGATLPLAILSAYIRALIALASRDAAGPADAEGV